MCSEKEAVTTASLEKWTLPPAVPERRLLRSPQTGQNVWPNQCCPCFVARYSETLKTIPECWFCRHADFHLTEPVALEVGICCYPGVACEEI